MLGLLNIRSHLDYIGLTCLRDSQTQGHGTDPWTPEEELQFLISSLDWDRVVQLITLSPFVEQFSSKNPVWKLSYFTSGCSPWF